MNLKELLVTVHEALQSANIEHALIGAFAMACYGIQRATGDIDFLIDEEDKNKAIEVLGKIGFTVFYQSDEVLQLQGPGNIDFLIARRPLSREMLKEAKPFPSLNIKSVSLEDIIGLKIQAYRNNPKREFRDKADIISIIETNYKLNWDKIKQYADIFNAWEEISQLRNKTYE
ncbi:MAG: hypothetical protein A3F16_03535 [Deltaproteobacteria bacterium RIFCSPHIGHO2_12_FULL_43_9]|nr:MAG: hypothetical protein A3F16_03535 [Deltaproteobacteria bacterium RIFCSPHIGHO2_12_FULL_43_9]